ncbi:MAG TPA: mechanosensitive ion channel family protein [Candidatus Aminicenantes bacterium]|nr:mechanosensitive ion channel family protein [Candidatus Aminicenantes bacterium]
MKAILSRWADRALPWLLAHGPRILVIVAGAWLLNKALNKFIEKAVRLAVRGDAHSSPEAERQREDTLIHIFAVTLRIVILTLAVLMLLQELGLMIGPMLAGAGIVGLAFGFGGQYLIRDVIAGLFIILENQYRIGDVVELGAVSGTVEDISLRRTVLRDLDGTVHYVPNGEIKTVSNQSRNFSRVNLDVSVAYGSDIEKVRAAVDRAGRELAEDPQWREFITRAPAFVRVHRLAESAVVVKILGETKPLKQWDVTGELRRRLLDAFAREGIVIPLPQVVVHGGKNKLSDE